jgi:putative membrane protein
MRSLYALALTIVLVPGVRAEDKEALDKEFIVKAHVGCNAVNQYAQVAESRSKNEMVKDFAEQIIKDHKQFEEQLAKAIKDQNIASVAGTEKEVREQIEKLKKLEGAELDREFLRVIVESHEQAIKCAKLQCDKGKDQSICTWAKDATPTLQKHLDRAKELQKTIK